MIEKIINDTCDYYNCDREGVMNGDKKRKYAEPRMIAMFLIRKHTKMSLKETGIKFGKNHSTVAHAQKIIGWNRRFDERIKNAVDKIESELPI